MLGILGLVAQGARSRARNRSHLEFQRTYNELRALETPPLVSTTTPARQLLIDGLHEALTAALPAGWAVTDDDGLICVASPSGTQLIVEVEPPGSSSRRGRCDEQLARAVPTYWLIAPVGPTIAVLTLSGGAYVEQTRLTGETYSATEPFSVTVPLQP